MNIRLVSLGLLFAACTMPPYRSVIQPVGVPPAQSPWQTGGRYRSVPEAGTPAEGPGASVPRHSTITGVQEPPDRPLYGWDGGVVEAPPSGRVVESEPPRGLEPSASGRMHIIELYQEVLDERDALSGEVESLTAVIERLQGELGEERKAKADLNRRLAALEAERDRLVTQNQELAARLTTAQIRRLEAEKMLLEARLAEHSDPGAASGAPGGGE